MIIRPSYSTVEICQLLLLLVKKKYNSYVDLIGPSLHWSLFTFSILVNLKACLLSLKVYD